MAEQSESRLAASDHTDEPAAYRVRFDAEIEVEVEIDYEKGASSGELHQALQDQLGYTGVEILDVTEWVMVP